MTYAGRVESRFTVPSAITISATTNAGTASVDVTAGSYYHATLATALAAALNSDAPVTGGAWTVAYSTTTGKYTIAVTAGTFSITWTSTALRDLLGFDAAPSSVATSTGALQARGLWIPDCVFRCDVDARRAPLATDLRTTVSPTGVVYALKSTKMYRLANPRWMHVPSERTWEADATTANASYETFVLDTQLHEGHAWFSLSSKIKIWDHTDTLVGNDAGVVEWQVPTLPGLDTLRMAEGIENGLYYVVSWPEIVGRV